MKLNLLILAALTVLTTTAFSAEVVKLQKGDISIYPVQVKLISVATKELGSPCGNDSICTVPGSARTEALLQVNLNGCADRLATTSYNIEQGANGKIRIHIAATAVSTKLSKLAKCMTQKAMFSVFIGSNTNTSVDDVELNDLNSSAVKNK